MNTSSLKRTSVTALAWLIPAFAILEPVWMLTPFVGFLYGSVLNLSLLESHRSTAWLLLFVLPARGIGLPGLILVAAGLSLFAVGARQVYRAKLHKQGMVTKGMYHRLRHPQYTGLILAAMGLVLLWSRFIAYLSLFLMVFLYFLLALKEEAICRDRFGDTYDAYCRRTLGLFPGADMLAGLTRKYRGKAVLLIFLFALTISLGSGVAIMKARQTFAKGTDLVQRSVSWQQFDLSAVSPRMPYLDDSPDRRGLRFFLKPADPEDFFRALQDSQRLRDLLLPFRQSGMNTIMVLFEPRLSVKTENGTVSFDYYLVPMQAEPGLAAMGLNRFRQNAQILGLLQIEGMQAGPAPEPVRGEIRTIAFEEFQRDPQVRAGVERKVAILLSRF